MAIHHITHAIEMFWSVIKVRELKGVIWAQTDGRFHVCFSSSLYTHKKGLFLMIHLMKSDAHPIIPSDPSSVKSTVPPEVEHKLLMAFGNSIVVEERDLFDMINVISDEINLTPLEFIWHLENMEERGLVAFSVFEGVRSWRRMC